MSLTLASNAKSLLNILPSGGYQPYFRCAYWIGTFRRADASTGNLVTVNENSTQTPPIGTPYIELNNNGTNDCARDGGPILIPGENEAWLVANGFIGTVYVQVEVSDALGLTARSNQLIYNVTQGTSNSPCTTYTIQNNDTVVRSFTYKQCTTGTTVPATINTLAPTEQITICMQTGSFQTSTPAVLGIQIGTACNYDCHVYDVTNPNPSAPIPFTYNDCTSFASQTLSVGSQQSGGASVITGCALPGSLNINPPLTADIESNCNATTMVVNAGDDLVITSADTSANLGTSTGNCFPYGTVVSGGVAPYTGAYTITSQPSGANAVISFQAPCGTASFQALVTNITLPGTYTLTLTVTSSNGLTASDSMTITKLSPSGGANNFSIRFANQQQVASGGGYVGPNYSGFQITGVSITPAGAGSVTGLTIPLIGQNVTGDTRNVTTGTHNITVPNGSGSINRFNLTVTGRLVPCGNAGISVADATLEIGTFFSATRTIQTSPFSVTFNNLTAIPTDDIFLFIRQRNCADACCCYDTQSFQYLGGCNTIGNCTNIGPNAFAAACQGSDTGGLSTNIP